ncbi:MAG: protein kinase [Gemmataceae bacterium]
MTNPCPSVETLGSLLVGELDDAQSHRLESHVEVCPNCQQRLDRMTATSALFRGSTIPSNPAEGDRRELPQPDQQVQTSDLDEPVTLTAKFRQRLKKNLAEHFGEGSGQNRISRMEKTLPDRTARLPSIPGYEFLEEKGRGGMGVVYKARHLALNRYVAVKLILRNEFATAEQLVRFRLEGEMAAQVQHPNIVEVYEVGAYEDLLFMVMEWVEGTTLAEELKTSGPLTSQQAAQTVATLAHAVHAAHSRGIIHRDLKPSNVLIGSQPVSNDNDSGAHYLLSSYALDKTQNNSGARQPSNETTRILKIVDFGLATSIQTGSGLTETGVILGTPEYMAPEQASEDKKEIGRHTDVYALGVMLYEMITGKPPFRSDTALHTLGQVTNKEPERIRRSSRHVPRDLETICMKCLEKSPNGRYPTAKTLAEDLERFLTGQSIEARPTSPLERAWKWVRRHPTIAGLELLVLLTFVIGMSTSIYISVTATRNTQRAIEREQVARRLKIDAEKSTRDARQSERRALGAEQEAQSAKRKTLLEKSQADLQVGKLQFQTGIRLAQSGEVAVGLFTMLDALKSVPAQEKDWGRLIRLNLAAWSRQLPVLENAIHLKRGPTMVWIHDRAGETFLTHNNNELQRWKTTTLTPIAPPRLQDNTIGTFGDLSPDETRFISTDRLAFLRSTKDGRVLAKFDEAGQYSYRNEALRFAGRFPFLVSGGADVRKHRICRLWNFSGQSVGPELTLNRGDEFSFVQTMTDQIGLVVFRQSTEMPFGKRPRAEFWDVWGNKRLETFPPSLLSEDSWVRWDEKVLISSRFDGSVRWWKSETGEPAPEPWSPRLRANAAFLTGLGRMLLTRGTDTIRLYDLITGLQWGGDVWGPPGWIKVTPDASRFVTCPTDGGTLRVWRLTTNSPQFTFTANQRITPATNRAPHSDYDQIIYSPEARLVFLSKTQEKYGRLVATTTNQPIGGPVRKEMGWEAVRPGGKRRKLKRAQRMAPPLRHPSQLVASAQSPTDPILALALEDKSVRLWDLQTDQQIGPPLHHRGKILGLVFSPEGDRLVVTTRTGRSRTWTVPTPIRGNTSAIELWLKVVSGMQLCSEASPTIDVTRSQTQLEFIDLPSWNKLRRQWQQLADKPDPACAVPPTKATWHQRRALDAQEDSDVRGELWHLTQLIRLRPEDWQLYARRGRAYARARLLEKAAKEYDRVEKLAHGQARQLKQNAQIPPTLTLKHWYLHEIHSHWTRNQWGIAFWYACRLVGWEMKGV